MCIYFVLVITLTMSTLRKPMKAQAQPPVVVPESLLTAQAINLKFAALRERFLRDLKCDRPTPFIVWRQGLTEEQEIRLQQAFTARAIKSDAELLEPAEDTFRWMQSNKRA